MNLFLSAIGWVTDAPQGNRLRWHYPLQSLDASGNYLGLPKAVVVERAPVSPQDLFQPEGASSGYPDVWWENQGDVVIDGLVPLHEHQFASPVQAITFTWRGDPTRILVYDSGSNRAVADRQVGDGEAVYAEAPLINAVYIFSGFGTLQDLRTLDLFRDRGLEWRPLAQIGVAPTFAADLSVVGPRYNLTPTLSDQEWHELAELANTAQASIPAGAQVGEPTDWDNLALVLGLRWELALLGGFAFFDGPRTAVCALDEILGDPLPAPPDSLMAYRVRDAEGPARVSNVVVCPPFLAVPLGPPSAPQYVTPEVHLRQLKTVPTGSVTTLTGALRHFSPLVQFDGEFEVHLTMRWQQSDPRALGVEVNEVVGPSPTTGSSPRNRTFLSRSSRAEDPPLQGTLARSFDVDFPDVLLQSRVRALDAWDRVSAFSAWSSPTGLQLRHEPLAPPLASAQYDAGIVRIRRALGVPDIPDWEPDSLVRRAAGRVLIYRQSAAPRTAAVTAGLPVTLDAETYRVPITGALGLSDFLGGSLSVGAFIGTVETAVGSEILLRVSDQAGGAVQLFDQGSTGRLTQDIRHTSLWTQVADFPADALPAELVFSDPLAASAGVVVESYAARLAYVGRLGPAGTIVRALRYPDIPLVPPSFTVEILGLDFFHRTMLKIRFTSPVSSGHHTVWWAEGVVAPSDLSLRGAAGLFGVQSVQDGLFLYDVMTLPIPQHVSRTVTIGVQRVVEGGPQSDFITVPVVIPALTP